MPTPPTAREAFDALGIDAVCDLILDGKSQREIGAIAGASGGSFSAWLAADPGRSARANEARRATSWHWDEKAEQELREAPLTTEGIARARELASHFRWRASKIDPRYGDRVQSQTLDKDGNPTDPVAPVLNVTLARE